MSTFSLQARLRRLERLVRMVLSRNDGVLFHATRLRRETQLPVVISVTHFGACLVYRVYTLSMDQAPPLPLGDLNPRKIHQLASGDSLTHWLSIDKHGEVFMIDPPGVTELPLLTPAALTCHHPLGDTVLPELVEVEEPNLQREIA